MKIIRVIKETRCPDCNSVLAWDAVGDISNDQIVITGWCAICGKHHDIVVKRGDDDVESFRVTILPAGKEMKGGRTHAGHRF